MDELLRSGHERRDVEFKSAFKWNNRTDTLWLREKVARSVIAMSNSRLGLDGGRIVIGAKENDSSIGLTSEQIESFRDYDTIKDQIDKFTSSQTDFDIDWGEYKKNKNNLEKYVIITVRRFVEMPLICKRDGHSQEKCTKDSICPYGRHEETLRKFDIYARSKTGRPASIRATDFELREIIEMGVEKEMLKSGYIKSSPNRMRRKVEKSVSKEQKKKLDEQIKDII